MWDHHDHLHLCLENRYNNRKVVETKYTKAKISGFSDNFGILNCASGQSFFVMISLNTLSDDCSTVWLFFNKWCKIFAVGMWYVPYVWFSGAAFHDSLIFSQIVRGFGVLFQVDHLLATGKIYLKCKCSL